MMSWLSLLVAFIAGAGFGYRWCLSRQRDALRRRASGGTVLLHPYHPPAHPPTPAAPVDPHARTS